jgi:hypothetical protein
MVLLIILKLGTFRKLHSDLHIRIVYTRIYTFGSSTLGSTRTDRLHLTLHVRRVYTRIYTFGSSTLDSTRTDRLHSTLHVRRVYTRLYNWVCGHWHHHVVSALPRPFILASAKVHLELPSFH